MLKQYLMIIAAVSVFTITSGAVEAYPQNTLFGTGYGFAGYNNFSNGAAEADAINKPQKMFIEKKSVESSAESAEAASYENEVTNNKSSEKSVSDIIRDYDEAPNAGYKTKYTYIEKDMSDYNPYTGNGSGVNDSKSIYTDGLGRLHFFGKGSRSVTQD